MKHLFCDCKTDEEKANFFLSGRAVETGIIAPAISNDVAMAYHRCAEFQKEIDTLRAKAKAMEQQRPFAWIVRGGYPVPLESLEWQLLCGAERPTLSWTNQEMRPLYALPGAQGEEK